MLFFWLPAVLVFVVDRLTKLRVMHSMMPGESIPVIRNFFHITSVRNTGAAFGLFAGNHRVFLWISLLAIVLVLALYLRSPRRERFRSLALGLVLGGALGNVYDRIRYREVVDFLEFIFGSYHFAVFNVADSAVSVGVALLAIETWRRGSHHEPALPVAGPGAGPAAGTGEAGGPHPAAGTGGSGAPPPADRPGEVPGASPPAGGSGA